MKADFILFPQMVCLSKAMFDFLKNKKEMPYKIQRIRLQQTNKNV